LSENKVISIVDDDESIRSAICSLLRALGFRANSFASAKEFLRSASLDDTDCLISDVQMPEIDGLELQRRIVTLGRRVPIIFITAFPDPVQESVARAAGAVCFLAKPFDGQALAECIEIALKMPDGVRRDA
jgi:FixJ family two-component response regulator